MTSRPIRRLVRGALSHQARATRSTAVTVALTISAIILSGCAALNQPTPTASSDGKLQVVASISNWADIAHEIGGDLIDVKAIISDPNKDPHSYEASARDQLSVNQADLVIVNGFGYDDFASKMVAASNNPNKAFTIATSVHWATMLTKSPNQHIWYNLSITSQASQALAKKFESIDPANASVYEANEQAFLASIGGLIDTAAKLAKITKGYKYFATESVADDLLNLAGFVDKTPKAFSDAIENETDVPPAAMQQALDLIKNHKIDYLVLNKQTSNSQIDRLTAAARDAEVRAVAFSELLPANTTYLGWMAANLRTLNPGM
jgi:zinc/manganese transport system substrate-binding protein